jgi:hypothetical protein
MQRWLLTFAGPAAGHISWTQRTIRFEFAMVWDATLHGAKPAPPTRSESLSLLPALSRLRSPAQCRRRLDQDEQEEPRADEEARSSPVHDGLRGLCRYGDVVGDPPLLQAFRGDDSRPASTERVQYKITLAAARKDDPFKELLWSPRRARLRFRPSLPRSGRGIRKSGETASYRAFSTLAARPKSLPLTQSSMP